MNHNKIKLVILGESNTGKSSLAHRLMTDNFNEEIINTIGACYMTLNMDDVKYEIWDTAGQERFLSLTPIYYRNSDIILLVYDLSSVETVDRLQYHLDKLSQSVNKQFKLIIVGNKLDLVTNLEADYVDNLVRKRLAKYSAENADDICYLNLSTKTGTNFDKLISKIKDIGKVIMISNTDNKKYVLPLNTVDLEAKRSSSFIYDSCVC